MMPIHMAALNGHLDCVKKLLNNTEGFDIDTTDDMGRTCLHAAACGGYVQDAFVEINFFPSVYFVVIEL